MPYRPPLGAGGQRARAALALALLFSLLCWSLPLTAQSTGEDEDRRLQSRLHFERGVALVRARGSWDAARAEFVASRELYPTKSATRNAAIALRELNRPAEALGFYRLLVKEFGSSMSDDELAGVRDEMSKLSALLGELEIQADVSGATVIVAGRPHGTTPLPEPLKLDPGTHSLKLTKDGFDAAELVVSVASGQRRSIRVALHRLRPVGSLIVLEANQAVLDVVLDSSVVGRTPWKGSVTPGMHSVWLQGRLGTAPSAAEVRVDQTTTLTLRAEPLGATLVVEPAPSNAAVSIDGVVVGNGVWAGRLPRGTHRVEVAASGHLPWRREVNLTGAGREVVRAPLERDPMSSPWTQRPTPRVYAEVTMGALFARTLHGAADDSCPCAERSRPWGGLVAVRLGYPPFAGAGVELQAGYLAIGEAMTRALRTQGEPEVWTTSSYRDSTRLRGGFLSLGASYRMLKKTPITARVGVGVAALTTHTENGGLFATYLSNPDAPESKRRFERYIQIEEVSRTLLTPFASTELRAGYRISKQLSLDLGVALIVFLPPRRGRGGANSFSDASRRSTPVDGAGAVWETGEPLRPGVFNLPPDEAIASTFLTVSPSLGARWDF